MNDHAVESTADEERREWLERRRTGIGGSDVAGILGLSPWSSPWSIWADKVGLVELDDDPTEAQDFGKRAEDMLRRWFEDRTGFAVYGTQAEHTDPDRPWMRVTLDGEVYPRWSPVHLDGRPAVDMLGVVEYKATSEPPSAWADGPPIAYQCQAAWSMAITGARRVWFGVLHIAFGRPAFRVYLYERDDDEIAYVIDRCDRFWHDQVLTGIPPVADGSRATTVALSDVYHDPTEASVEADEATVAAVDSLRLVSADLKVLEERETELKNRVRAALGDATVLTDGTDTKGRPVVLATWRTQNRVEPGLDLAALAATYPAWTSPDGLRTPRPVRVLLIKQPKKGNP